MTRPTRSRRGKSDPHETGLFVDEQKDVRGRWAARSTRRSLRGAQDCAWDLLTREGGEVRVRQGRSTIAKGSGLVPSAR